MRHRAAPADLDAALSSLRPRVVRWLVAGGLLAVSLSYAPRAHACSTCSTGDPTLTVTGVEQPFEGRTRVSFQMQHRTESTGVRGVDAIEISEQRFELSGAYALTEGLFLATKVPLVRRRAQYVNLARDEVMSLGDVEVFAKWFLYRDRSLAPRHLVALNGGLSLPTGTIFEDADGRPLPLEAQVGSASLDALAGVSYSWFFAPFSMFASINVGLPVWHGATFRTGAVGLVSWALQYQPLDVLALRLSLDARLDQAVREVDEVDPHSGGLATVVSPELVLSPFDDLVLRAVVQLPAYRAVRGEHLEGVSVLFGAAYDL